jgi:hypothetical protein
MEQISSHWTDFHKNYNFNIFKNPENIQVLLKSGKNNEHFTWKRTYSYDNISPNSS